MNKKHSSLENTLYMILFGAMMVSFIFNIICVIHSGIFIFSHIHLTRMEAFFHSNNHVLFKLIFIGLTYILFKIVVYISENW